MSGVGDCKCPLCVPPPAPFRNCGAEPACIRPAGHEGPHMRSYSLASGRKDDDGKRRYTLLPWKAIDELAAVLEHGARKYGDENWRQVPDARRRYIDAALRHIVAYHAAGEREDRDSKRHHLAHAAASLLFLVEMD